MLDAMLLHEPATDGSDDSQMVVQRAEEVRHVARLRIQERKRFELVATTSVVGTSTSCPETECGVFIRRRGLSEKLLKRYFGPYKILRLLRDLNYEVAPDGTHLS